MQWRNVSICHVASFTFRELWCTSNDSPHLVRIEPSFRELGKSTTFSHVMGLGVWSEGSDSGVD